MDHCAFFLLYVWCCCFYSGHSCQQYRRCLPARKKERGGKRHTHGAWERERERRDNPPSLSSRRNWAVCQAFAWILSGLIYTSQKRDWSTIPDNYLFSIALIFCWFVFNTYVFFSVSRSKKSLRERENNSTISMCPHCIRAGRYKVTGSMRELETAML